MKNNGSLKYENELSNKNGCISGIPVIRNNQINSELVESDNREFLVNNQTRAIPIERLEKILIKRNPILKRYLDIIGSLIAMVVFFPVMLIIVLLIKLESKGPVFYKQKRAGIGGRTFNFYKFRSMVVDAEKHKERLWKLNERKGPVFKIANDPRVTKVGRFIRRWSLDELPQLYNVLIGDLSLVGPRPPTICETPNYNNWHNMRLEITPGITCIWQVYARHDKCFDKWVRLDIEYIRKYSLFLDLKILFKTIPAIISGKGAC